MIANTTPMAPQSSDDLLIEPRHPDAGHHLQDLEHHRADQHRGEHGPERDVPVRQPPRRECPRHCVDRHRRHREQRREPRGQARPPVGEHDPGGEAHADARRATPGRGPRSMSPRPFTSQHTLYAVPIALVKLVPMVTTPMNPTTLAKRALSRAVLTALVTTFAASPLRPSALVISLATSMLVVSRKPMAATARSVTANRARNAVSVIEFASTLPWMSL